MQKNLKQKIFKKSSLNELLCQSLDGWMDGSRRKLNTLTSDLVAGKSIRFPTPTINKLVASI